MTHMFGSGVVVKLVWLVFEQLLLQALTLSAFGLVADASLAV